MLFGDTDAFTTAVFHEVYLGRPATAFPELVARTYDLYVVCGLDAPWRHDGIREFEEQRRTMHDRYVEHARASGRPWLLVEGPLGAAARGGLGCGRPRARRRAVGARRRRHEVGTKVARLRRQVRQRER